MKISTFALAATLAFAGSAFAAQDHDASSSGKAATSTHQLASNFTGALHKIGAATRHAWHRADASLHRLGRHDSNNG